MGFPFLKGLVVTFNTTSTITTIHRIHSLTGPSPVREAFETTHVGTTGGWKTFDPLPFADPGEVTVGGEADPTAANTINLMVATASPNEGVVGPLSIALYSAGVLYKTWACASAFATKCDLGAQKEDAQIGITMTFKLSGAITIT